MAATPAQGRSTELIKGVSYGPVPLKSTAGGSQLPQDDWMAPAAKPMWGPRGRGDLKVIKSLGANMVRTYGNSPENDHSGFLNEAYTNGLKVAPGLSDWPYFQNPNRTLPEKPCLFTEFDCYSQVKPIYLKNLKNGFLLPDGRYHPAMAYMSIMNEPDLKMPHDATIGGRDGPKKMCKAIITAFDAMLDAEKEAGLRGTGINFTVTFSFAVCKGCENFNTKPALGQMAQLEDAMRNPSKYGYTNPRNDLAEAFRTRWTHSFNTQNGAQELPGLFLNTYEVEFATTPVYIAEYHSLHTNQTADLGAALDLARESQVFLGISFFQFQEAYWKGGSQLDFGMFALGRSELSAMSYFGKDYGIFCLEPVYDQQSGVTIPAALAAAYGGSSFSPEELCMDNPESVPLDGSGFATISKQKQPSRMATFVNRVVQHLGAFTIDQKKLTAFSKAYVGLPETGFRSMVVFLVRRPRPRWTFFDSAARCVADRNANADDVVKAIDYVCANTTLQEMGGWNCSECPEACKGDVFSTGDWVFGNFYSSLFGATPLQDCNFSGAAIYASAAYYSQWAPACVVDPQAYAADVSKTRVPAMQPAVPFTPFHPPVEGQSSRTSPMGGDGALFRAAAGAPILGIAEAPGLATAQASGHGAPGPWWLWLLLGTAILGCVSCMAYSARQKRKKAKAGRYESRKTRRAPAPELGEEGEPAPRQEVAVPQQPRDTKAPLAVSAGAAGQAAPLLAAASAAGAGAATDGVAASAGNGTLCSFATARLAGSTQAWHGGASGQVWPVHASATDGPMTPVMSIATAWQRGQSEFVLICTG
eukprot:CAMPEP_0179019420 /NCGR_PEP_ID=MMETSP0796-20121207/4858_1 /TAXON_ID=73915 /ORGANISM="Pyrodinium bahamense, Strain pbaha01" /LENGTH=813 /DNA_ID=CAMNT_0020715205 /DNA_START=93 /DNA_END=2529 /DNA_ORIENTATION=-